MVNIILYILDAEHNGRSPPFIPGQVFLIWYIEYTPRLFERIVDLSTNNRVHHVELPRDFHGPVDRAEINEAAQVVRSSRVLLCISSSVIQSESRRFPKSSLDTVSAIYYE